MADHWMGVHLRGVLNSEGQNREVTLIKIVIAI